MTEPPVLDVALRGLCPRCGSRTLFAGPISFAPRCRLCALDLSTFNVGDGPAAFLTLIIGGVVTLLAILTELNFQPPVWVHLVLWIPLTLVLVLAALRVAKAALLALEYHHRAREARIDPQ
ncbi:DUF983 domain-containing protein [Sphingomonas sp.]|uniref:DUF983 domain-containing protein n=1 Tax=Sphingomonas sp. TaxID=28214 RepID=UPI002DB7A5CF|nr:DUF983 domain-containing protein [Sphingomonas sp.]HEU4969666.1 DUF983 domain-containing protein [Sphingomonas sp.]